jgi:vacuolar-type H+-ATPase subunit E/Vma4
MSLDKILEALELEAEAQVVALEQTTKAELERIQAKAQVEAELARQKRLAAIQTPLQTEQTRILNKAKLAALQIVLGTREELLAELLESVARRLASLSKLEGYDRLLQQLLQEAIETLGSAGPFRLEVQMQDIALMQKIAQEMGLEAEVEGNLQSAGDDTTNGARKLEGLWGGVLGGVAVTTQDGQVSLVNTFETRLERAANLYRTQIAEMLFEGSAASPNVGSTSAASPNLPTLSVGTQAGSTSEINRDQGL